MLPEKMICQFHDQSHCHDPKKLENVLISKREFAFHLWQKWAIFRDPGKAEGKGKQSYFLYFLQL